MRTIWLQMVLTYDEKGTPSPEGWDWHDLLELAPNEHVYVTVARDQPCEDGEIVVEFIRP